MPAEHGAPTSTTHLCVVDRDGNMVTLTQTLLALFGSRIVLPGSGILMNNGMNWFNPVPGGPNSIAPDRAGLANYAPAIMTGSDEVLAIGGCGGRRILPAVFQLLAMCADFGLRWSRPSTRRASTCPVSTWWWPTGACRPRPSRRSPHSSRPCLPNPSNIRFPTPSPVRCVARAG